MKKAKRIVKLFILLIQVLVIRAGCSWNVNSECEIRCISSYTGTNETPEQVMASLEEKWRERENCHFEGITLNLDSYMYYPDFTVKAHWFTAAVKVKELIFNMNPVTTIEVNAFNSDALKTVTKLTLPQIQLNKITKGIFNGLDSVEVLALESANLKVTEIGVLDVMKEKLKEFRIIQWAKQANEAYIDGFTGSEVMKSLEKVKFNYNLKKTINRNSFLGLRNVKTLDLSDCQIQSIGEGAFDAINGSVIELNLQGNAITTLPDAIFSSILPNAVTTIYLGGNKWDCECHLMPLKLCIIENSNIDGLFECSTPPALKNHGVIDTNFCDNYVPPSTTTFATTSVTTTITTIESSTTTTESSTTTTEQSMPEEFNQECYEADESELPKIVTIKMARSILTVNEHGNGDVVLDVDSLNENSILIWFSSVDRERYYTANDEITCLVGQTRSTSIPNLRENTAYTFCLMDSTEKTVSPLDCISYTKRHTDSQPWLFSSSKGIFIGSVVAACIVSALIGLIIGILVLKKIQKGEENKNYKNIFCINEVLKEAFQQKISKQQSRLSYMTEDTISTKRRTNVTVDYYLDHSEIAPPLPARPYSTSTVDEPIYDVVRYTGKVK